MVLLDAPHKDAYTLGAPGDILSDAQRREIAVQTGARVASSSAIDAIWQALTDAADPMGDVAPRPLMPGRNGRLELHLDGIRRQRVFNPATDAAALDLMREQYRKTRQMVLDGILPEGKHRQFLDVLCLKARLKDGDIFIPADLPVETRIPHQTPITESFDKADSAGWDADTTWTGVVGTTETVSNRARGTASIGLYCMHVSGANASADMYAAAEVYISAHSSADYCGPSARHPSDGTNTQYWIRHFNTNNGQTFKYVGGSLTGIGSNTTSTSMSDGLDSRIETEGTSIRRIYNGTTENTATDSAIDGVIVGGAYGGIRGRRAASGLNYENDNFETDVLAAPAVTGTFTANTRRNTAVFAGDVDNITGTIASTTRRNTAALEGSVDGVFGPFAATTRRDAMAFEGEVNFVGGPFAADTRRNAMAFEGEVTGNVTGVFAAATRRNAASLEGEVDNVTGEFAAATRRSTFAAMGVSGELEPGGPAVRMRHYLEKQVGGNGQRG